MTSVNDDHPGPTVAAVVAEEMTRYGITRVPVDYFHLGDFRYTSLADAIAQAQRRQRIGDAR